MSEIASQITSLTTVYSIVYSDADQRKHQSSESLAFMRGIHRGPVNSPHKWPVTRKMFPFDNVIMSVWPSIKPAFLWSKVTTLWMITSRTFYWQHHNCDKIFIAHYFSPTGDERTSAEIMAWHQAISKPWGGGGGGGGVHFTNKDHVSQLLKAHLEPKMKKKIRFTFFMSFWNILCVYLDHLQYLDRKKLVRQICFAHSDLQCLSSQATQHFVHRFLHTNKNVISKFRIIDICDCNAFPVQRDGGNHNCSDIYQTAVLICYVMSRFSYWITTPGAAYMRQWT